MSAGIKLLKDLREDKTLLVLLVLAILWAVSSAAGGINHALDEHEHYQQTNELRRLVEERCR